MHYDNCSQAPQRSSAYTIADGLRDEPPTGASLGRLRCGPSEMLFAICALLPTTRTKLAKPKTELPPRMLADILLDLKRPQEALYEYKLSLRTEPNRFNGLYGSGRPATHFHKKRKRHLYTN